MPQDALGNKVSIAGEGALSGIDDFVMGFLANETRIANILQSAEQNPASTLANIYAGMIAMFADVPNPAVGAKPWAARARKTLDSANTREKMNFALLENWIKGDVVQALEIADQVIAAYPTDLVALKIHQTFNFHLGNAPEMLRIAKAALPANSSNPYLYGMLAFGYEQMHFLEKAEESARKALEIKWKEPWSHHALAHVMLTTGRVPEGIKFMRKASESWQGLNSFMYTHNWWHLALFHINNGDPDKVFETYDTHCWGIDKSYAEDQIGAVSLLARMEFAGMDVGARWVDVGDHLRVRAGDTLQPFMTMQYLYGLAKAELPEADMLMAAVEKRAATAQPFEKTAWQHVALPACRGLLAHAHGQFELAVEHLTGAMPRMMMVGGSHAQRDLFAQILLDAHIKCGHYVTAQEMLQGRRRYDPNGVPLNRMLANIYEKLGLLDEAAEAAQRRYN